METTTKMCNKCFRELALNMYGNDNRTNDGKKLYCIECESHKNTMNLRTVIKWTQEEKEIIINEVKNYPTNIYYAFEQAAKKLPRRNKETVAYMWYNKLRNNTNVNAITTGSENGFTQNVKNKHRDKNGDLPDQGLKHYMYVLKEILNLPQKERDIILQVFNIGNININTK